MLNFFVIFYTDYIIIKGAAIVVILFIYYIYTSYISPFEQKKLNIYDKSQAGVCLVSILLALTLY